jgi:ACS family hexuronate transporter-like MFS transporter
LPDAEEGPLRARWTILALLLASTTLNYLDRAILGVLLPVIREEIPIDSATYGSIQAAFQLAYTAGALACGAFLDRYGTRIGMAATVGVWSAAAFLHGLVTAPAQFALWRGVLGLAEAGNFPAATKVAAEWFPVRERGLAVGVFNAGTTVASIAGPPALIALQGSVGWRACFYLVGALGFLWLLFWWRARTVSPLAIATGRGAEGTLRETLSHRAAWGYAIAKLLTDPAWWFLLFWLPLYFKDVRGLDLDAMAWALSVVYLTAGLGAVIGGWLPGRLMRGGMSRGRARKGTMAAAAALMPAAGVGVLVESAAASVGLLSLATFAHQAWATNLFTTSTDVFPTQAVGRVTGLGGAAGGLGGVLFSALIPGFLVGRVGFEPLFLSMAAFYAVAWWVVHRLMGDLSFPGPAATGR